LREFIKVRGFLDVVILFSSRSQLTTTRDSTRPTGAEDVSDDMQSLNGSFSRVHAMSIHLNLITIIATLFHGWPLSSRLDIDTRACFFVVIARKEFGETSNVLGKHLIVK
jgi:hypothetical protein